MNTPTPRTDALAARPVCIVATLTAERDQLRAELATERAHRKELSALVIRFVREARRARQNILSLIAVDYLVRHKLHGEPIRPAVKEDAK